MEWIRRAGDYRTLLGKRDHLGFPLGEVERTRLEALERFFIADGGRERISFSQRDQMRRPISVVVQFGQTLGTAKDISGDGLFVATDAPLAVGSSTVVRVADDDGQTEWRFSAEVVRLQSGEHEGMGLRFVGIPLALRLGHRRRPRTVRHAA